MCEFIFFSLGDLTVFALLFPAFQVLGMHYIYLMATHTKNREGVSLMVNLPLDNGYKFCTQMR